MKFFQELLQKAVLAFKRFPVCMLWAVAGSIYFLISIAKEDSLFEHNFRWDMIFILGISWLIGTAFFVEQFEKPKRFFWLKLVMLLLLGLYCWSLPEEYNEANKAVLNHWWLMLLAGHVFIFFAPFVRSWDDVAFWNYLKNILIAIGRSLLFSGVLYAGLALALIASDTLFNLDVNEDIFAQLFVLCLGVVNTCIYLSDFPKDVQNKRKFVFNKALAVFVKFILLPLLLLYFFILYIYGFKILFSWELPQGWLSGLISVLAIVGFAVQIMINPWKEYSSFLIRKFYPWFYILLLPVLILLFVAVFRRINDYNFTEARYFLMLLSFWILGMSLYLLIAKKRQMRVLPISLFILILLSSFGPWNAFQFSVQAQVNELEEIYKEIDASDRTIENNKAERFQDVVYYLEQRDELKKLEPIIGFDAKSTFGESNKWRSGWAILDSMDVVILPSDDLDELENQFFHFNREKPIFLKDHSYSGFAELHWPNRMKVERDTTSNVQMVWEKGEVVILSQDKLWFTLPMDSLLRSNLRSRFNLLAAEPEKLDFELSNDKGKFRLIFSNLYIHTEEDSMEIREAKALLFFALKQ